MNSAWVIAKNTYKEIIRDRLLYGILLIGALVTASSFFLATVSLDQNGRVMQNLGLAAIHLFTVFICIFVATNSMAKDFERRTLYLLLPKPISRSQYIVGKFFGFLLLLLTTLVILGGLFLIVSAVLDKSILLGSLAVLAFAFIEISFLIALGILFSTFTAPLNAALYTVAFFIIGHSLTPLKEYLERFGTPFLQKLFTVFYYLLPNLEKFDIRQAVLFGIEISPLQIIWALLYWLIYTVLALGLAILVMNSREV